jgi:high-affinity Fe2+/Pb2+ permease
MLEEQTFTDQPVWEARVTSGLILLLLIGVLIGFGITRVRRRMGLGVTGTTWLSIIAGVVIIGLLLWVTSAKH